MPELADEKTERRRRPGRPSAKEQDAQAIVRDILIAARDEFVEHGLNGARVDRIAERAGANKRLLYHYVGNKQALYTRVLTDGYRDIREGEAKLRLDEYAPTEAMQRLVGFTFDHFRDNPWFIRLLSIENVHHAKHIELLEDVQNLQSPIIALIRSVLAKGEQAGEFRSGVDPLELYITIAGLSYFYFSNAHTLSVAFGAPLLTEQNLENRRAHVIEVVSTYLTKKKPLVSK